jgi:TRAP-type C4-dicarboxylate transport system permease small subunit
LPAACRFKGRLIAGRFFFRGARVRKLEKFLGVLVALSLFAMMLLTFFDVVGRKFFDTSLPGSLELTELLMLVLIFFALPLTSLYSEHVIFDLLDRALGARARALQHVFSNGLCALLLAGSTLLVFERAARTAEFGDTTAQLLIHIAPFHYLVALALAVSAMMHLVLIWRGRDQSTPAH